MTQAQTIQYTQNKPDQALRSPMRVDPSTLALSLEVPIANYPGRASLPINLIYSSKQWRFNFYDSFSSPTGSPRTISNPLFSEWAKAGWTTSADIPIIEWTGGSQIFSNSDGLPCDTCPSGYVYINRIHVHMPGGASHELRLNDTPVSTLSVAGTYYAVDSSNLRFDATSYSDGTLFLPDGSKYVLSATGCQFVDRNGNTLSYSMANRQWTDTQNRVLDLPLPATPSATTYTYSLPSTTGTFSYSVRWSTLQNALTNSSDPLRYLSNMTGGYSEQWTTRSPALFDGDGANRLYDPIGHSGVFNPLVLAEIILPNGQHYLFTYNVWGEITKVIYPTGGYERFDYAPVPGVSYLEGPHTQSNRGVVDRWLSPSGNGSDEQHWHYSAVKNSSGLTVGTTAPDNTLTERVMSAEISQGSYPYGFSIPELGMQLEERSLVSASGAMLRRKLTKWASSTALPGGGTGAARNPRAVKEVDIWLDTGTSNALTATTTMSHDNDLNLISKSQYDFTSISKSSAETLPIDSISAPSLPSRTDEATYLVNDGAINSTTRAAYRARNLLALPTSTRVKNSAGTEVAKTKTNYDDYDETCACYPGTYSLLTYGGSIGGWIDPGSLRGLPTTSGLWLDTTNSYLQTHARYDQFGNLRVSWDANGKQSQISYASNFSYAFPTSSSTAVPDPSGVYGSATALTTTADYNANTGLMTLLTDPNGQSTSYAYDAINRLTTITHPDGGQVTYSYFDQPTDLYVRVLTKEDASRSIETREYFDGRGRPVRSFLYDGTASTPWLVTDTYYDNLGRSWKVSNPYRVSSASGTVPGTCSVCTTTTYDALDRVRFVTTPDSAQVETSYSASTSGTLGTITTFTDQVQRKRRSLTDALGRLLRVDEPNKDTGSLDSGGASTFYTYNLLGNLLRVDQDSQQRFFSYDSLGRLLRAKNTEQGAFTPDAGAGFPALTDASSGVSNDQWSLGYIYDNNGNLLKRRDARNVMTTYAYDALNRNTTVRYTDGTKDIDRHYDNPTANKKGLGRFHYNNYDPAGNTRFDSHQIIDEYDSMGRPLSSRQHFYTNGVASPAFSVARTYDKAGHVLTQSYPSGRSVSYTYDVAGRTESFSGNLGDGGSPLSYSSEIVYSPLGGMTKEKLGTDAALYNKLFYNSRGQLAEIRVGTYHATDGTFWNRGAIINHYSDNCWGSCGGTNSTTPMTDNNGNLQKQEIYLPNSEQPTQVTDYTSFWQQYNYDALNRLKWVREITSGEIWKQEFTYDRFGNRTIHQTNTYGSGINKKDFTVNTTNNRLGVPGGQSGTMTYDPAGNLTTDTYSAAAVTRAYDAENRMTSETQAGSYLAGSYTYSADGQRIRRKSNGVDTWQAYGFDGELLAEYPTSDAPGSPQKEYGYRNGQVLITAAPVSQAYALQSFVLGKTLGAQRADSPGWTGFKLTVGAQSVIVNSLGRYCSAGNSQGHDLRLIRASDNSVVASTNVNMSGCAAGQFKYATLPNPVTLSSGTAYLLVSYEAGSDLFHDWSGTVLSTMAVATVNHGVYTTNGGVTWGPAGGTGSSYVPLDFQYQTPPSQTFVTSKTLAAQRSDSPGWTGLEMMVGGQSITVSSLGRYCSAGNSLTHELRVIRSSDNVVLASTNVSMSGCTAGQTKYAALAAPLTLSANTAYRLVSYEVGSDNFHDWNGLVLTTTSVATVLHGVYTTNGGVTWGPAGGTGSSYVPVDFQYSIGGSNAGIEWLVADQLGTPRMVVNKSGSLSGVKRHDYLPFGEEISSAGVRTTGLGYNTDLVRQKFTQKERDIETGLDYFLARYYSSTQGRFSSPDPIHFQASMVNDPQRFNLYAYVRNNPLGFVDPEGEAIELLGTEEERTRILNIIKGAVGKKAGAYLYSNAVTMPDGSVKYFVGVKDAPPGGKEFKDVNSVAGELKPMVDDSKVVGIQLVAPGTTVDGSVLAPNNATGNSDAYANTVKKDENHWVISLPVPKAGTASAKKGLDQVDASKMENNQPGKRDWSVLLGHELGHARGRMTDPNNTAHSNASALRLENKVRNLRYPGASNRNVH